MTTEPIIPIRIEAIPRSPEQIAQDISASHDSVNRINQIVAAGQHSNEIHNTVDRNVRHLQNCLTLTHIIENATDADTIAFAESITLGGDFIPPINIPSE
jgi:hypothetical protein